MLLFALVHSALAAEPEWERRDDTWRRTYMPDPHLAFDQSLVLGFGSGHFYAHDKPGGFTHLGLQTGGLLLTAAGAATLDNGGDGPRVLLLAGATTFLVSRIVDMVTAPLAAHRYAASKGLD